MTENKGKILRTVLLGAIVVLLIFCAFGGGLLGGVLVSASVLATPTTNAAGTPSDLQTLFKPFWETWDLVHSDYYIQPVDNNMLLDGAIRGMLDALPDDHSGYLDPQETEEAMNAIQGEYDGIGAYVNIDGEYLTVVRPMPNSPAEAAGLRSGDQIIAVNGEDVTGKDPNWVRTTKVMGPAGTTVHLTIRRPGVDELLEFDIVRAHIEVPSVESEMLEGKIGYLRVSLFGEKTGDEFHSQLEELMKQEPVGLIVDLRDNSGGLTTTATQVASEFISKGVIWYEQTGDGSRHEFKALPGGLATGDIPLIVLVNEWSASASELVAGAIQDTGRGKLLGVKTFGKGSVQVWEPLSNGGTARVTIALWLTPSGRTIDKIGLTPDKIVTMTQEDYDAGRDPQRDAAVQWLLNP